MTARRMHSVRLAPQGQEVLELFVAEVRRKTGVKVTRSQVHRQLLSHALADQQIRDAVIEFERSLRNG